MLSFAYAEINALALVILFLLYVNIYRPGESRLPDQNIYLLLLFVTAMELIMDTAQWLLDGQPGTVSRVCAIVVATVYCIITPLPCYLWSLYAGLQVNHSLRRLKRSGLLLLLPIAAVFILGLLSIRFGLIFRIDGSNIYHRGPLFLLMAALCYSYIFFPAILALRKIDKLPPRTLSSLLAFAIVPFVGGIIQVLFYGISLIWPCFTLSLLIIFINIQNRQLRTDNLTGLHNRRQLEDYLREWAGRSGPGSVPAGIMLDIDSFKKINDHWGHDAGDEALVCAGKILGASFRKEDLICRYGGDEFIVLMRVGGREELLRSVERLKENLRLFNQTRAHGLEISFSVGCDLYDLSGGMTPQQYLRHLDSLMYEDKQAKREKFSFDS